jgi:L-lysine exporter family protein LysE/ArgO
MFALTLPVISPAFTAGIVLSLSLIMAIGPQNAHVLRMGLQRQHVWLTVAVCIVADVLLIALGVLGLAQLGGLSDKLQGALVGAGVLFLAVYGWEAARRFLNPVPPTGLEAPVNPPVDHAPTTAPSQVETPAISRKQAVLSALAFSWLNPHAWLDTAVLIGTASLAYGTPGQHRVRTGGCRGLNGVVCGVGRGRVLARPPPGFGDAVALAGRLGGIDDVGYRHLPARKPVLMKRHINSLAATEVSPRLH